MTIREGGQRSSGLKAVVLGALFSASLASSGSADAVSVDILDTGTPPANPTLYVFSTAGSFGAEFNGAAGNSITQLNVYLTQGAGQPGETFNFVLYSGSSFLGNRNAIPLQSWSATYEQNGWTDLVLATPYTLTTTGPYWITVQAQSGTNVDVAGTSNNGVAPAIGFAYKGTGSSFAASSSDFGIQVLATPLPGAGLLLLTGLSGLGIFGRRNSAT